MADTNKWPAFQFYPGDWFKEPTLRACSLEARGLWIDMLCMMHSSPVRGILLLSGTKPMEPIHIARVVGASVEEVETLLTELRENGVYDTSDDGAIISRRMVKDEAKRSAQSEAGRKGAAKRYGWGDDGSSSSPSPSPSPSENSLSLGVLQKDDDINRVLAAVPIRCRRAPATFARVVASLLSEAVNREAESRRMADTLAAYYASAEGRGRFWRAPAKFIEAGGLDESPENWNNRTGDDDGL